MSRQATDILRVLAAIFIVFNHSNWGYMVQIGTQQESYWSVFSLVVNQFGKPAVLFFIFLSGFAFANQVAVGLTQGAVFQTRNFFYNRIGRILPLYIFSTFLGLWATGKLTFFELLRALPDGSAMPHLYFLPLILFLYALFPMLLRFRLKKNQLTLYLLAGGSVLLLIEKWMPQIGLSPTVELWTVYALYGFFFFFFGVCFAFEQDFFSFIPIQSLPGNVAVLIFLFAVVLFDFYGKLNSGSSPDHAGRIWRFSVAVYALFSIHFVSRFFRKGKHEFWSLLARASFLVYIIHPFLLLGLDKLSFWHPYWRFLITVSASWFLALGIQKLAKKNKIVGILFGEGDHILPGGPIMALPAKIK